MKFGWCYKSRRDIPFDHGGGGFKCHGVLSELFVLVMQTRSFCLVVETSR